jgi:hypothetical protein
MAPKNSFVMVRTAVARWRIIPQKAVWVCVVFLRRRYI